MKNQSNIRGTKGYLPVIQKFTKATLDISFENLHRDFLPFIPQNPSLILDLGAGIGKDANWFAQRGHITFAAEPLKGFRMKGKELFKSNKVHWIEDSMPLLAEVKKLNIKFDFVLVSGVWHHLDIEEQTLALNKIYEILNHNGILAISLRNGPAGAGKFVFPTDGDRTKKDAENLGLKTMLYLKNRPSIMKNKQNVIWSRLILKNY